jgi:molybdopterin-guanine dinucleotide biosynthesis protein A
MQRGAIVLAGGQSRRMGQPKAWLPFGEDRLLTRILRILKPLVTCRIVVAAPNQDLLPLPEGVLLVRDRREGCGPLEGLWAGLSAGVAHADVFYASSCDVPLLKPAFVNRLFELMGPGDQIVVPRDDRHFHPLAAVYHRSVLPAVAELLAEDRLRPYVLFERVRTRAVDSAQLRDVDPRLDSLRNLNTPEEYQAALRDAGLLAE